MLNKFLVKPLIFSIIVFSVTSFGCASEDTGIGGSVETTNNKQESASVSNTTSDSKSSTVENTSSDNKSSTAENTSKTSKEPVSTTESPAKDEVTTKVSEDECENATGAMVEPCTEKYRQMIENDPSLCDSATGMMAYMCNNSVQAPQTKPGYGNGHSSNPCISLPPGDKERCEQSFKENPNARPEKDPHNTGKADPNARLATDAVDYTNVYVATYDPDNIPKVATSNFTELDKFSKMSKIRSGVGHDFSYNTPEYDKTRSNCKSMKHYFMPAGVPKQQALYASTPHTFPWMSIKFFSPVDGRIVGVYYKENKYGTEANFTVASSEHPGYFFMFFHIALDPSLKEGSVVKAGQQIGTLGDEEAWGEIATSIKIGPGDHRLVSFLEVATDEVVKQYKARGFETPSDVIVTKEQRDANPLPCDNSEAGWFFGSSKSGVEDIQFSTWVFESTDNWFPFTNN